jgi:putative copper export protein
VLPVTWETIRLFLHVLAATIWVGGQLTLAGLVPGLRALGPDAPRTVARRFNRIAWPAFAVLVATGIWNIAVLQPAWGTHFMTTLIVKIVVVVLSGVTAFLHATARSRLGLAVFGALTGVTALAALFLGILLAGEPDPRRAQFDAGSSGKFATAASGPGWRRSTRRQSDAGSGVSRSSGRASTTNHASSRSSPSS